MLASARTVDGVARRSPLSPGTESPSRIGAGWRCTGWETNRSGGYVKSAYIGVQITLCNSRFGASGCRSVSLGREDGLLSAVFASISRHEG